MWKRIVVPVLMVSLGVAAGLAEPIGTHPVNPHYFVFHGQPTILITSAEHYGAVINGAFDYVRYLDTLKAHGLNYTRFYAGAMLEPVGKFITGNTLGVKPRDMVLPWARSESPGYVLGGNRFDLDRWNDAYFARLKDFLTQAAKRGIVVEICFFNSQYSDTWPISPLYFENNVQGEGRCDWRDAQTLKHADVVRREDDYVRKITQEVNAFDNVVLEICDEPASIGTGVKLAGPWVSHLIDTIVQTEHALPQKHLVAQEVEGPFGGAMDFSADPRLTLIVSQYLWGREPDETGGEMGGLKALEYKYGLNKPIELNETDYYPIWYRAGRVAASRVEAWEFLVGGGAGFNQLNGLFTPENPAGAGEENERLLNQLEVLKKFLYSFDFVKMRRDREFVADGLGGAETHYQALSEPGQQYALYIHHGTDRRGSYKIEPGKFQEKLSVRLPAGRYRAEWIDPEHGAVIHGESFTHGGGPKELQTPVYAVDIALRLKRN